MSFNPYSPPTAALDSGVQPGAGEGFKSLTPIATAITIVMAGYAALEVLSGWNTIVAMRAAEQLMAGQPHDESTMAAINLRAQAVWFLSIATKLAAVVLFCIFMPRANRNARWFRSPMSISPGWAAGYFFVPILSLWKPYQAMKEIWQGSDPDPTVHAFLVRVPPLLPWWWALYISYNVAGSLPRQVQQLAGSDAFVVQAWAEIARALIAIAAALLAIAVVRAVARRQDQRYVRGPAP